jgi:signal transduction histidine kinase/AraC-like DNA-binding protein/CheY-like chemotaxis protein/streptogramin lyase
VGQSYLRYINYTQSSGLSDNYVNCVYQDHRGFIWIGTWSGLNRFDGFNFRQYTSNKNNPKGMLGNWIYKIFEDRDQNLWVCTSAELMKYDWITDQFLKVKGLDSITVFDIAQDKKGFLWITSDHGLVKYNPKRKRIEQWFTPTNNRNLFPTNNLSNIVIDSKDNVWLGSNTVGLIWFNTKTNSYRLYGPKPIDSKSSLQYNVSSLVFDRDNRLWMMALCNDGLAIFDTVTKTFCYKRTDPKNGHSLPNNAVSRVSCDNEGTIWVCCQNESLCKYEKDKDQFYRYTRDPFVPNSLNAQSVSCLFEDNVGNYWIGSHGNGLYFLNKQKNIFKSYSMLSNKSNSLPGNIISSFAEMPDGNIIISTDGGGFCVFNRKTEVFETYSIKNGLLSNAVTKVLLGKDNNVWIACWNGGIAKFDYNTKKIINFIHKPNDITSIPFNNIKDIYPKGQNLWVVTHGEGLAEMDMKTNKFISHYSGVKTPFDYNISWSNSIMKDSKNRLWISTNSMLLLYDGKLNYEIKHNLIHMTIEDSHKQIWIVSEKAIDIYNEQTKSCVPFEGIADMPQNPKAIIEDLNHNLWISSNRGLSCIDADRKHIKHFTIKDGLPSNDFVYRSVFRLKDGTLLFGGTFGFVMFHPDSLLEKQRKPVVVLNELFVNHKVQIPATNKSLLKRAMQSTDTLIYLYNHDIISFSIVGIAMENPNQIAYSYKIKGLNDSWIDIGNERLLTIPNLEPGSYTLYVKAYTNSKSYSVNGKGLLIIVLPPWWRTLWFKFLLFLLLMGCIVLFIYIRLDSLKKDTVRLEALVKSKTKSLQLALDNLNEANLVIEMKNKELVESIDLKDKLIGVIGHDFRSPLNAITGLLNLIKLQIHSISGEKLEYYITTINQSAQKLTDQMIMMTDWAQSRYQSITYNPVEINIESLLNDAILLVKENARQKNITISVQAEIVHNAFVDARMIHTVILNLLSNAIKFSNENGTILVTINEESSILELSVIDTGVGIENNRINDLLNKTKNIVTTAGTKGEQGLGFGLQICNYFIEKNKGTISIKSQAGNGSVFTIMIPVGKSIKDSIDRNQELHIENEIEIINDSDIGIPYSILIIDDDEALVAMLQQSFEQSFKIVKAYDGKSGLYLAQNSIPDLIISDIKLPGMTGFEVCNALKKDVLTCHIPVIMVSGEQIPGLQSECFSYGADDFFQKPFNVLFLKQKMIALLETIRNQNQNFLHNTSKQSTFTLPDSADDIIIQKIVAIINERFDKSECEVDYIAAELGLSRTQLWRKTKNYFGKKPSELIRDLRLQKAAEMIVSGKYRVSDIAYNVGFTDPRYFSRSFFKAFGMSPTDYFEKSQKTKL